MKITISSYIGQFEVLTKIGSYLIEIYLWDWKMHLLSIFSEQVFLKQKMKRKEKEKAL